MAIATTNIALSGLSGRVGNLIFRQRYGKTVVYCLPCPYPPSTLLQKACQAKFTDAVRFAKMAKITPELISFFNGIRKKNQSIYHAAISYYMLHGFHAKPQREEKEDESNKNKMNKEQQKVDFLILPIIANAQTHSHPEDGRRRRANP